MDAPSGLTEEEGRELFEERPNSQGSHKGRQMRRASLLGASRQASTQWRLVGTLAPFGRCEGDGKGAKLDAQ